MLKILGQMEAPALILDNLYLGTEWNASHQQDLFDKEYKKLIYKILYNFFTASNDKPILLCTLCVISTYLL